MSRLQLASVALAALLVLAGCGKADAPAPTPPEVTVAKPARRDVQRYVGYPGRTRAVEFAEIRARVSGSLQAILFDPSTMVEADQVLFEIEPETYQASYNSAVAEVASARAELQKTSGDLARVVEASKSNAVSQSDVDQARASKNKAAAAVLQAEAALERAGLDLGYTRPRSPIAGMVGRNLVDAGNLVGTGEPTLLTTVARLSPIFVYFDAPESLVLRMLKLAQVERGKPPVDPPRVVVATAADDGFPHEGQLDFIDNKVNPDTGTIELRAVLPNEGNVLFPGLFVRIRILAEQAEPAVLVNERSIGTDLGGKYVMLVGDENVVEQRYVTLGPVQEDGFVVVDTGLTGDETYIEEGLLRARPGFPVTPQTAGSEPAPKAPPEKDES